MYTFRFGKIYNYDEENGDTAWTKEELFIASSYYATCKHMGYSEDLSYSLSFMYVSMINQPELKYEEHSKLLKSIASRVERA